MSKRDPLRDSYAPVRIETVFYAVGSKNYDENDQLPLADQLALNSLIESVEVEIQSRQDREESDTSFTLIITFYDSQIDTLDELTYKVAANSVFDLTYGYETDAKKQEGRTLRAFVTDVHYAIKEGMSVTFTCCALTESAAMIKSKNNVKFSYGDKTVTATQVMKVIAEQMGWKTVLPDSRSSIAESKGFVQVGLYYPMDTYIHIFRWIKTILLPHAHDADNRAFEFYFDLDNVVHFHPSTYLSAKQEVIAEYDVRAPDGEVLACDFDDVSFHAAVYGYVSKVVTASDPNKGTATETTAEIGGDDNNVPKSSETDSKATNDLGITQSSHAHGQRTQEEVEAFVAETQRALSRDFMKAQLIVRGTHDVTLYDNLRIIYRRPSGAPHFLSGEYKVFGVRHKIDSSGWTTEMAVNRDAVPADAISTKSAQAIKEVVNNEAKRLSQAQVKAIGEFVRTGKISDETQASLGETPEPKRRPINIDVLRSR